MKELWYPVLCVVVPCAIGLVMYLAFEQWDRRRRRKTPENGLPFIDYNI